MMLSAKKIEGQATTYAINKKGKLGVYSHNFKVNDGAWAEYASQVDMEVLLKKVCKELEVQGIAIQGELIGPGIQCNQPA